MPNLRYFDYSTIVDQIVSRNSELKLFKQFLDSNDNGAKIADRLFVLAQNKVSQEPLNGYTETAKDELVEAIIRGYKQKREDHSLTAYDELILDLIAVENNQRVLVNKVKQGKISLNNLPNSFPGMRKRAEVFFRGKVTSDLKPDDYLRYKAEKQYTSILRDYARDLFFVANNGAEEKTVDFLRLKYELDKIKTSDPITSERLRQLILKAMVDGEPLELVHIKSLRFTYPQGTNLKILDDTEAVEQAGFPGEIRRYPTEEVIFQRIDRLREIFRQAGISTRATLIVSDHDLNYCFPTEQNIVPAEDVARGQIAGRKYIDALRSLHPEVETIRSLTEFLVEKELSEKFERTFTALVREGEQGGGKLISEKVLEMRVNEQFEHYKQMFGRYSRKLARFTAIQQISSLLSLSVIFESFTTTPLMVIDSRGFEDRLIGGCNPNSVVKFFTKFKNPTEIVQK